MGRAEVDVSGATVGGGCIEQRSDGRRSARAGTGWAEDGASRSKGVITPHTGCADAGTGLSNALPFTAVRLTSGSSALARPADRVPLAAAAGTT